MPGKSSTKLRVAGYCRVSTAMQAEGLSIGLQQSQIEQFCEKKGWDLVHVYVDEGYSAKNFNRPDVKQLLEDMTRGRFSVIVITRVDRLVRSLPNLLRLIRDRLEPAGVRVISIAEDIDTGDTSSQSRNVLALMGITAELERQVIRERVIPAVKSAAKSGRVGTHRRYGYRTDDHGKIRVDPGEKKVVQRIFKWAGNGNLSITAIANKVREEGVTLSRDQVRYMLHNRFYLGELEYNRTTRGEDGKKRPRPEDEWIVIRNHHPAIIDSQLFNRVQKSIKGRYLGGGARSEPIERLLSSDILRCAHCGSGVGCGNLSWSGPHRKRMTCYFCVRRKSLSASVCPLKPIKREELESLVLEWFDEWFDTPEIRKARRAAVRRSETDYQQHHQRRDLLAEIDEMEAKLKQFDALAAGGQLAEAQLEIRDDLTSELADLRTRLESLIPSEMARWAEHLAEYEGKFSDLILSLDAPDQKALIQNLVERIEIVPGPEIQDVVFRAAFQGWQRGKYKD